MKILITAIVIILIGLASFNIWDYLYHDGSEPYFAYFTYLFGLGFGGIALMIRTLAKDDHS